MFDHAFALVPPGGPEADLVARHGLIEGRPNLHPGQGTANRRFFFRDGMLELLWVEDAFLARQPEVEKLGLAERAQHRETGACPFGIAFVHDGDEPPFPGWPYRPAYLPAGATMWIAEASVQQEQPLVFTVPTRPTPPTNEVSLRALHVTYPEFRPGCFPTPLDGDGRITLEAGPEALMELELAGEDLRTGVLDLRPAVPLVLRLRPD